MKLVSLIVATLLLTVGVASAASASEIKVWGIRPEMISDVPSGRDFVQVSAGWDHAVALERDGSITAWGSNQYGQLDVPEGDEYSQVSAGGWFSVALRNDGSVVSWGYDGSNQDEVPEGNDFVAVSAGGYHALALREDGSIVAWGYEALGEASPPDGLFSYISAGTHISFAIRQDGSLAAWGRTDYGQLNVPPGTGFLEVTAGIMTGVALRESGEIVSWGHGHWYSDFVATSPEGFFRSLAEENTYMSAAITDSGEILIWDIYVDGDSWALEGVPTGAHFTSLDTGYRFMVVPAEEIDSPPARSPIPHLVVEAVEPTDGGSISLTLLNTGSVDCSGRLSAEMGLSYCTSWIPEWNTRFMSLDLGERVLHPGERTVVTLDIPNSIPASAQEALRANLDGLWTGYIDPEPETDYIGILVRIGESNPVAAFIPLAKQ